MFRLSLPLAVLAFVTTAAAQEIRCTDGQAALPDVGVFDCSNVDLVGYLSRAAFAVPGSPEIEHNDIWGWTDPQTGTEYALVGTENGTGFVDLSSPTQPILVGKLPSPNGRSSVWRDVKVYGGHAFIVADSSPDHGIQIFDLNRLRGVDLANGPVVFTQDANYQGISSAHNVVINEETGFAYAVGYRYGPGARSDRGLPAECDAPGFHAVDIQDPKNPTFAGCFSDVALEADRYVAPGYTHDGQCLIYQGPDEDYRGRELCFGANEDVVTVFDVTDKSDVEIVSQGSYPNYVYTHQGWLTADQRYFLVNDEIDESTLGIPQRTIVMDMADLDSPEVAFIYDSGLNTIDHNLYTVGRYAFEANYESGLRILDLGQIESGTIKEVAFFDTYPQRTGKDYNGAWSVYPYFESGLVVVNDINNGLFVLRPDASLNVGTEGPPPPNGFALSEPAPNPTATVSRLVLEVDNAQLVRAELFDIAGRRVADVFEGTVVAGASVVLEVAQESLPAGVYVLRVVGEQFEASRRIVLVR